MKDILVLGIESSCDETSVAVVKNGREVLSNVINSQIKIHEEYGGVVPEIASRCHTEVINQVMKQSLKEANVTLDDIDVIATTYGPGLVGALLVGVAEAKAIAFATDKPLVGVHHIEGHISANYIENKDLEPPFALGMPSATAASAMASININTYAGELPLTATTASIIYSGTTSTFPNDPNSSNA